MDRAEHFSQKCIEKIAHDMCHPLGIMHSRTPAVIHRDISLDNVLVNRINRDGTFEIVINDFDVIRELTETDVSQQQTVVGKINYWAPEVLSQIFDVSADMWSVGVVLFELMTLTRVDKLL